MKYRNKLFRKGFRFYFPLGAALVAASIYLPKKTAERKGEMSQTYATRNILSAKTHLVLLSENYNKHVRRLY